MNQMIVEVDIPIPLSRVSCRQVNQHWIYISCDCYARLADTEPMLVVF